MKFDGRLSFRDGAKPVESETIPFPPYVAPPPPPPLVLSGHAASLTPY